MYCNSWELGSLEVRVRSMNLVPVMNLHSLLLNEPAVEVCSLLLLSVVPELFNSLLCPRKSIFSLNAVALWTSSAVDTHCGLLTKFLFQLAFGLLPFSSNVEGSRDWLLCLKQFKSASKETIKSFRNHLKQVSHYLP